MRGVALVCYLAWVSSAPVNDLCESATVIGEGITQGTNIGATSQTNCIPAGDIFFQYSSRCTGYAKAVFRGTGNADLKATRFTGSTCATLGNEIGCTDQAPETLIFQVTFGQSYYLAVGAYGPYQGMIEVEMTCYASPSNDLCTGATLISDGLSLTSNVWATRQTSCIANSDVFLKYQATCTGNAVVVFLPSVAGGDLKATRFTGTSCTSLGSEIGCTDSAPETLIFSVTQGQLYHLAVGDYNDYQGTIKVNVSCFPPPANDMCTGATIISDGTYQSSNAWATKQTICAQADIFFKYVATCSGAATVIFNSPSRADLKATRFSGSFCGSLQSELDCTDNAPETLNFAVTQGQGYYLAVGAYSDYEGVISVTASCAPAPLHDLCAGAVTLTEGVATVLSNVGATAQTSCIPRADIYVKYTPTCVGTGAVMFFAPGQIKAALFQGQSCSALGNEIYCTTASTQAFVVFFAVPGQAAYLAVGAADTYRGTINASALCLPSPSNDFCEHAQTIWDGRATSTNKWATSQTDCIPKGDVFFKYTASCSGTATAVFTAPSGADLKATSFAGHTCSTLGQERGCTDSAPETIHVSVTMGQDYYFAAGSYGDYQGAINVDMSCETASPTYAPYYAGSSGSSSSSSGLTTFLVLFFLCLGCCCCLVVMAVRKRRKTEPVPLPDAHAYVPPPASVPMPGFVPMPPPPPMQPPFVPTFVPPPPMQPPFAHVLPSAPESYAPWSRRISDAPPPYVEEGNAPFEVSPPYGAGPPPKTL